jgi:hypothetical protein
MSRQLRLRAHRPQYFRLIGALLHAFKRTTTKFENEIKLPRTIFHADSRNDRRDCSTRLSQNNGRAGRALRYCPLERSTWQRWQNEINWLVLNLHPDRTKRAPGCQQATVRDRTRLHNSKTAINMGIHGGVGGEFNHYAYSAPPTL